MAGNDRARTTKALKEISAYVGGHVETNKKNK